MSQVSLIKPARIACVGVSLLLAWSCTVADKGDYTFTDTPGSGGHGATSGSPGNDAGKGGSKAGAGGRATGGRAGHGAAGEGGVGAISAGGAAGEAAGEGGASTGEAGTAGQGGEPAQPTSCDPNPCVHGTCSVTSSGFSCACEAGYEGPRCAVNHDDCAPNPCLHGGVCADRVNDFKCDCNGTGYSGTTCQTAGPCVMNPCLNGGVCNATGTTTYTCDCTGTGYEGSSCETNHNDCTATSCSGVGGRCIDLVNGFKCACGVDADCGGAVLSCDPVNLVCRSSITKFSEGTKTWPDDACNPLTSFGQCDTNDQTAANVWATQVCRDAGWTSGVWTGRKSSGCGNTTVIDETSYSMWCLGTPCVEQPETMCQPGNPAAVPPLASDQTVVEFTCSR